MLLIDDGNRHRSYCLPFSHADIDEEGLREQAAKCVLETKSTLCSATPRRTARSMTTGEAPIVLRTEADTGHGVGKPTDRIVREQVDRWTWLCDRLGVDV